MSDSGCWRKHLWTPFFITAAITQWKWGFFLHSRSMKADFNISVWVKMGLLHLDGVYHDSLQKRITHLLQSINEAILDSTCWKLNEIQNWSLVWPMSDWFRCYSNTQLDEIEIIRLLKRYWNVIFISYIESPLSQMNVQFIKTVTFFTLNSWLVNESRQLSVFSCME